MNTNGITLDTIKAGIVFLRRERPGFDPDWGAEMEKAVREQLDNSSFQVFIPETKVTDDHTLRSAVSECREQDVDVLITLQTTMSDGRMAPVMAQLWNDPLIMWATPEKQTGSMISACSLVGIHTWAATYAQSERPFEIVYGMPGENNTVQQLNEAVRVAYTARRLRTGKTGLVGFHAPGFIDMHADPFLLNNELGMQFHYFSIGDFLKQMETFSEDQINAEIDKTREMKLPLEDVSEENMGTDARYYLTMRSMMEQQSLDSLAVRDWPELSDTVGQWPYVAMTRLSSEGLAVGCEGDVDGAISCLLGNLLGGGVSYLSDWLEHDSENITLWHAGNAPYQLCEPIGSEKGPRIGRHFNITNPAVVNADLRKDMPVTVFRLWHCSGKYYMTARNGKTVPPKRDLKGSNGLANIEGGNVHEWFETLCHAGFPHHPAVVEGHHTQIMRRFARQMGIEWID